MNSIGLCAETAGSILPKSVVGTPNTFSTVPEKMPKIGRYDPRPKIFVIHSQTCLPVSLSFLQPFNLSLFSILRISMFLQYPYESCNLALTRSSKLATYLALSVAKRIPQPADVLFRITLQNVTKSLAKYHLLLHLLLLNVPINLHLSYYISDNFICKYKYSWVSLSGRFLSGIFLVLLSGIFH
jgi:hypothetical protein